MQVMVIGPQQPEVVEIFLAALDRPLEDLAVVKHVVQERFAP